MIYLCHVWIDFKIILCDIPLSYLHRFWNNIRFNIISYDKNNISALNMPNKKFQQTLFWNNFLIFNENKLFSGKNKKNITNLLSAELAHRVSKGSSIHHCEKYLLSLNLPREWYRLNIYGKLVPFSSDKIFSFTWRQPVLKDHFACLPWVVS